jgi:hypothetical protein
LEMYLRSHVFAVVSAIALAVAPVSSYTQTTNGSLVGVVRDSTGAVIPGAAVTARNVATGVVYTSKSSAAGEYRILNLPNGTYDVTTSVNGFSMSAVRGLAINSSSVITQDVVLTAAGQNTVVEISSQASVAIDTTTAQISSTFSLKEVQDLPAATVGLGVLNLSLLAPGVTSSGGLGAGTGPAISGQRPRNNNFEIEGIDNNSKSVTAPCSTCQTTPFRSSRSSRTSTPQSTATRPAASSTRWSSPAPTQSTAVSTNTSKTAT